MRSPIYANDCKVLNIGHRLESNVQPVIFDLSTWISQHGDGGTVSLIIKRAGEDTQYLGIINRDGATVTWVPNAADTGRTGFGEVELRYTIDDESNALSRIWQTSVCRSLEANAGAPDPYEPFAEDVAKAAQDAKSAKESIENMTVSSHESDAVSVEKSIIDDHVNLDFGIPIAKVTKQAVEDAVGGAVAKADYVNANFNSMQRYIDTKDAQKADKTALDSTNNRVEQVRADAIGGLDTLSIRVDLDWADTEAHINNTDVHASADEKSAWNSKADGADLVDVKTALTEVENVAYNRSYPANADLIADNNVYDVVGIPQYLTAEMAQQYTGKTDAESGWYWFGWVIAPNGMKVEKKAFQFYGSKNAILGGQPNDGDDRIMVAIRFDALGSPVGFSVKWNSTMQRSDPFMFRCDDLAIRNLDYKTTYYVYDLAPYATVADNKVTFEGMTQNVTYQYKVRLDKPVEIILPQVDEEEGHGVWMELQLYFTGAFSLTLVPPEGVVVKNAPTPTISAGYNVIDLMYYNIDGVKCWRVQNTKSTF